MGKNKSINKWSSGKNINEALPASPVEILGINGAAKAGDDFLVLDSEKEGKVTSWSKSSRKQRR